MKKVLVIVGPTAVGKTSFSIEVAKRFTGEIISGDSIQVYKGFDIGSGKIKEEEKEGIPHFGIDILNADDSTSVADFQQYARDCIEDISVRGALPMIVGGTGLYIKACIYDYTFQKEVEVDKDLLSKYEKMSNEELVEYLSSFDKEQAKLIHPNNRKRLIRACTIYDTTKITKSEQIASQEHKPIFDAFIIGCTLPRDVLYQRINQRVEKMIAEGLENEIKALLSSQVTFDHQAMQGIGYREWKGYFNGVSSLEEVVGQIQKNSRNFAKRQYTWFNNQTPIHWVDMSDKNEIELALEMIEKWRSKDE